MPETYLICMSFVPCGFLTLSVRIIVVDLNRLWVLHNTKGRISRQARVLWQDLGETTDPDTTCLVCKRRIITRTPQGAGRVSRFPRREGTAQCPGEFLGVIGVT